MEIPYGFCQCNCGSKTKVATKTDASTGRIRGVPMKYCRGHNPGRFVYTGPQYLIEDRGYKTPCWVWQYGIDKDGYGILIVEGEKFRAHRYMFEKHRGLIPVGLDPDHLCRVRPCVNPWHLEPVTRAINTQRGALAKLTPEMVMQIRQLRSSGKRLCEIQKQFPVSYAVIRNVCNGVAWTNVE